MKMKTRNQTLRFHPYKIRDEITWKFIQEHSVDDMDKLTLLHHSELKMETTPHPKNGENKHGNSDEGRNSGERKSSIEKNDKTRGKKRRRDDESDQSSDEERIAKKGRFDAVPSWAKVILGMTYTAILPKWNNKRPASDTIFPAPPNKKPMTITDETSKNDENNCIKYNTIVTV